jgi:hypothetical protein
MQRGGFRDNKHIVVQTVSEDVCDETCSPKRISTKEEISIIVKEIRQIQRALRKQVVPEIAVCCAFANGARDSNEDQCLEPYGVDEQNQSLDPVQDAERTFLHADVVKRHLLRAGSFGAQADFEVEDLRHLLDGESEHKLLGSYRQVLAYYQYKSTVLGRMRIRNSLIGESHRKSRPESETSESINDPIIPAIPIHHTEIEARVTALIERQILASDAGDSKPLPAPSSDDSGKKLLLPERAPGPVEGRRAVSHAVTGGSVLADRWPAVSRNIKIVGEVGVAGQAQKRASGVSASFSPASKSAADCCSRSITEDLPGERIESRPSLNISRSSKVRRKLLRSITAVRCANAFASRVEPIGRGSTGPGKDHRCAAWLPTRDQFPLEQKLSLSHTEGSQLSNVLVGVAHADTGTHIFSRASDAVSAREDKASRLPPVL